MPGAGVVLPLRLICKVVWPLPFLQAWEKGDTPAPATPRIAAAEPATEVSEVVILRELPMTLGSRLAQVRINVEPGLEVLDLGLQKGGAQAPSIGGIECCSRPLMPLVVSGMASSLKVNRLVVNRTSVKALWSVFQSGALKAQWLGSTVVGPRCRCCGQLSSQGRRKHSGWGQQ